MAGTQAVLRFDGPDYEPARDGARLSKQYWRVFTLMADGQWRSLLEIERATGYTTASIGARLRDMRKARFGGHDVQKRYCGDGLFEYRLVRAD